VCLCVSACVCVCVYVSLSVCLHVHEFECVCLCVCFSRCHLKDTVSSKVRFVALSWGECSEQKNKTNEQQVKPSTKNKRA